MVLGCLPAVTTQLLHTARLLCFAVSLRVFILQSHFLIFQPMIIKIYNKKNHSFFSHFMIANILLLNNSSCKHLQIVSWEMNKVKLLTLVSREHGSDVCDTDTDQSIRLIDITL